MKFLFSILLMVVFMSVAPNVMAQEGAKSTVQTETDAKSEQKRSRRKKVMMCHECGKPETECECEGEGHGVEEEDHDHDHDE